MTFNKRKRAWGLISISSFVVFAGCARSADQHPGNQLPTSEIFSSTPPFKTLEPTRYQAVRTTMFTNSAGTSEISRVLIAKDGNARREELVGPDGSRSVYLHISGGNFILIPQSLVYSATDEQNESMSDLADALALDDSPQQSFHPVGSETVYRQLDQENLNGRSLKKYQVVVNSTAAATVSNTETFVWVDEELGMPIRTETKTANGSRTVIELTEISTVVEKQLFQIPQNYQKVKPNEIRQWLGRK